MRLDQLAFLVEGQVATARETVVAERIAAVDRLLAEKDADTAKIAAEARKITETVAAEAQRLRNEAEAGALLDLFTIGWDVARVLLDPTTDREAAHDGEERADEPPGGTP